MLTLSAAIISTSACTTINEGKTASSNNGANVEQNRNAANIAENTAAAAKPAEDKKQVAVTVYDGRDDKEGTQATTAEKKLVGDEYNARKTVIAGKVKVDCDEETTDGIEIDGVADGAFTKAGAAEKVYLYEVCRSGRSFGIGGLMFVDNGKVIAHYVYGDGGLYSGIASLPDIDKNGLSEIVLEGGGTGQGYTEGAIDIFQNGGGGLVFIGRTDTYSDDSGAVTDDSKSLSTAYKISVTPAAKPIFSRDTYEKKGTTKIWSLIKNNEKLGLKKSDAPKFTKIS